MKPIRRLVILVMTLIFLFGLAMMLYPFVRGYLVDFRIGHAAQSFLSWVEVKPFIPDSSESHGIITARSAVHIISPSGCISSRVSVHITCGFAAFFYFSY